MDTSLGLTLKWLGYFGLVLLPSFLVLGLFFVDRRVNPFVFTATLMLAVFGAFMAVKSVEQVF